MTVLSKRDAAGFETGRIIKTVVGIAMMAVVAIGIVLAVNPSDTGAETLAPAATELSELNELNKADIGVPATAAAPFLNGTDDQTHRGRTVPVYEAPADPTDPADRKFK